MRETWASLPKISSPPSVAVDEWITSAPIVMLRTVGCGPHCPFERLYSGQALEWAKLTEPLCHPYETCDRLFPHLKVTIYRASSTSRKIDVVERLSSSPTLPKILARRRLAGTGHHRANSSHYPHQEQGCHMPQSVTCRQAKQAPGGTCE